MPYMERCSGYCCVDQGGRFVVKYVLLPCRAFKDVNRFQVCLCVGPIIWFLAIIYFMSGVPGAYVLWYRPLYRAT
ncbi:UNVERIFIED_CONTAM: Secretory carrier-associated membrane protein 1, partial [Sesamum radiatum]